MSYKLRNVKRSLDPSSEEIHQLLYYLQQGRFLDAERVATRLIKEFPNFGFGWKMLGTTYLLLGRNKQALPALEKAVTLLPDDPDIHSNLGLIFYDLNRLDLAEKHSRLAVKFKPNDAVVHNNLGNILQGLDRLEQAESCFRRAIAINPKMAEAHYNLGYALHMRDCFDDAAACYRRALEVRPHYADAYIALGDVYKKMGYMDEALKMWRLSFRHSEEWQEALKRLTSPILIDENIITEPQKAGLRTPEDRMQNLSLSEIRCNSSSRALMLEEKYTVSANRLVPNVSGMNNNAKSDLKKMDIVLIYPPLWQISSAELPVEKGMPFGAPALTLGQIEDSEDLKVVSQGLLSIAAQAMNDGHNVRIFNLHGASWIDVVTLIANTKADIFGISAYIANRRGMGALSELIRQCHPEAYITVGGPFVTVLPVETLKYYPAIDTAVIGEGEVTFLEVIKHLSSGEPTVGIPGTAWRRGEEVILGAKRKPIDDFDEIVSQFDYFESPFVVTSRGCPSKCSYCVNPVVFGQQPRFYSPESCIRMFNKALNRQSVPCILVTDDTFTADKDRVSKICDEIIENKMNFIWECGTRVDVLDDELLRKMRLAGCQRIEIGVESGSQELLNRMHKNITPEMVLEVTRAAQKYGMFVHYYLLLISHGETPETINKSIELVKKGRPTSYDLSPLAFRPGTEVFRDLCHHQGITPDIFFLNDFTEISVSDGRKKDIEAVLRYVHCGIGNITGFEYTVEEREAVVSRLPNLHSVHVELANAYLRAGLLDKATSALQRAEDLGFPIENVLLNQHACISFARNRVDEALSYLEKARQSCPDNVVIGNDERLRRWDVARAGGQTIPCMLNDSVLGQDFIV